MWHQSFCFFCLFFLCVFTFVTLFGMCKCTHTHSQSCTHACMHADTHLQHTHTNTHTHAEREKESPTLSLWVWLLGTNTQLYSCRWHDEWLHWFLSSKLPGDPWPSWLPQHPGADNAEERCWKIWHSQVSLPLHHQQGLLLSAPGQVINSDTANPHSVKDSLQLLSGMQHGCPCNTPEGGNCLGISWVQQVRVCIWHTVLVTPVSYTHLTLPTTAEV